MFLQLTHRAAGGKQFRLASVLLFSVTCAYCSASTSETIGPTSTKCQTERDRCSDIDERFGRSDRSDGAHISRVRVVGNYQCDLAASPAGFGTGRSRHYASGCREQASERTHRRDSRQWPRRDACAGCLCSTAATAPPAPVPPDPAPTPVPPSPPTPTRLSRRPRARRLCRRPRARRLRRRLRARRLCRRLRARRLCRRPRRPTPVPPAPTPTPVPPRLRPRRLYRRPRRRRRTPPASPPPSVQQFSGTVSSLTGTCPVLSFTVGGRLVRTDDGTQFTQGNCKHLSNGMDIGVTGTLDWRRRARDASSVERPLNSGSYGIMLGRRPVRSGSDDVRLGRRTGRELVAVVRVLSRAPIVHEQEDRCHHAHKRHEQREELEQQHPSIVRDTP